MLLHHWNGWKTASIEKVKVVILNANMFASGNAGFRSACSIPVSRGQWPCIPKLVDTFDLTTKATDFVALSHVWGSLTQVQKDGMSTTSLTLDARRKGIRLETMPLQYRAVVVLCRCFRFRYLWIDSLCIIQVGYTRTAQKLPNQNTG